MRLSEQVERLEEEKDNLKAVLFNIRHKIDKAKEAHDTQDEIMALQEIDKKLIENGFDVPF